MFGLIDGNNFYVSCERAFDPTLIGKPVIVLSNNDGCAIARSAEAKALGIKMGEVWHLSKGKPEFRGVIAKSSNYALYGDMSRRVFEVLSDEFARVEPYSIDEMFLDLTAFARVDYCRRVRDRVRRITKIPTSIGIGPTKTLAKLANKHAKGGPTGVSDFSDIDARRQAFAEMPIGEIWGVGGRSVEKLNNLGIHTVEQFAALPSASVRKLMTVTGQRTMARRSGLERASIRTGKSSRGRKMIVARRQTRKGYVVSRRDNQAMPFMVARAAGLPGPFWRAIAARRR